MAQEVMGSCGPEGNTPVAYKGVPVMTTELLAEAFGATAKNIQDNHANNRERFSEGVHFFKVTGADLSALRLQPDFVGVQISPMARHLILWTEKGAARHAKILDTDEAWAVYEQLEDTYFAVKTGEYISAPVAATRIAPVFKDWMACAKLIGLKGNEAVVRANRATARITGVNVLEQLGETKLLEENKETSHPVTAIAKRMDVRSPQMMNKLLEKYGYQTKHPDEEPRWQPTEKGLKHAKLRTVDPLHGKGKSHQQWEWFPSVIDAIQADISASSGGEA